MFLLMFTHYCARPPADTGFVPDPQLWVSGYHSDDIAALDHTGTYLGSIEPVPGAQSAVPWSEGWLLVAEKEGQILSWDMMSGLRTLITDAGSPTAAIEVGSEILVADYAGDAVNRYDAATGAPLGALATGLDGPDAGMLLGPDGLVYVPLFEGNAIVTIDPDSGEVATFADNISRARGLAFGDGVLYATSWGANQIRRYALDGTRLEDLATVTRPTGLALEPDGRGIWVASDQTDRVLRLDTITGDRILDLDAGVDGATFVAWRQP